MIDVSLLLLLSVKVKKKRYDIFYIIIYGGFEFMVDWSATILGSIVTAVLTIVLGLLCAPLFFIGPLIGGFVTILMIRDEDKGHLMHGALSGLFGGLIVILIGGLFSKLLLSIIEALLTTLSYTAATLTGLLGTLIIIFISIIGLIISILMGLIGGLAGKILE